MSVRHRSRPARLVAAAVTAVALVGAAAACGGGGDDADSLQSRSEALQTCLNDAGLRASTRDAVPFGVESAVLGVTVEGLSDADNAAQVWLFETTEDAAEARPLITLVNEDDQRNALVGRTVLRFNYVPSDEDRSGIEDCLVAPVV